MFGIRDITSKKYKLETVSDFLSRILIELRIKK